MNLWYVIGVSNMDTFFVDTNLPDEINKNKTWDSVDCFIAVHDDNTSVNIIYVNSVRGYYNTLKKRREQLYNKILERYKQLEKKKDKVTPYERNEYQQLCTRLGMFDIEINDIEQIVNKNTKGGENNE